MKTYLYHSKVFERDVKVTYNDHGVFMGFEIIGGEDINKLFEKPKTQFYLKEIDFIAGAKEKNVKYVEVAREVTFEMFWQRYDYKDCGRKKCEEAWNKLTQEERVKAYDYVNTFKNKVKTAGTGIPYPTSYLNQKRWVI